MSCGKGLSGGGAGGQWGLHVVSGLLSDDASPGGGGGGGGSRVG